MEITFREEKTHIIASCSGEWQPSDATEAIKRIKNRATETAHTRILVDWRNVSAPKQEFYRFLLGVDIARLLPPPLKVVGLYPKELINKFAETSAFNRGAIVMVCHEEEEALLWLLDDMPKTTDSGEA